MKLNSLSDIFERRLLRIPDYQRGYAWKEHQVEDFWEDILQLESDRIHYTGVITLEPVRPNLYQRWEKDLWLIEGVGFRPFYVVDGQQRLTTSMILLQAILESVPKDAELNYQSIASIRKQFIFFEADNKLQQSFIFGYEKDNPSDEYMKTKIFGEYSGSNQYVETLYTRNLSFAKKYFKDQLAGLSVDEIALIYKKLTQKLKFNLYEIDEEIDVFVTFETMNNRGKPLTSLELLKNRLIYLSTLFKDNEGREQLRVNINDAWKTMYEYLGKNPDVPLSDNLFLRNHWTMYFKYTRRKGDDYIKFLLDEKFNARNVTHPKSSDETLKIEEISDYVRSLQQSIVYWFYMHNPYYAQSSELTESQKLWLDRLERLSFRSFKPLILSAFVSKQDPVMVTKLLGAAERYNFTLFNLSQRRSNTGDTEFFSMSRDLLVGSKSIQDVVYALGQWVKRYYDPAKFLSHIEEKYELDRDGFYHWDGVRYFLYEHEQWLRNKGKQATSKLSWDVLRSNKKDHVTLEHIFPQTPDDEYWVDRFGHLDEQEQRYLTHSLGNLLPLSRSKNASLQNDSFPLKVNNGSGVGYYNGSVSENEVAQSPEWRPEEIFNRGLTLLEFMEQRWNIELGNTDFKNRLLHTNNIRCCSESEQHAGVSNPEESGFLDNASEISL
ncbi:DUF262 domain-containing protein [Marinobacter zhejiangensis]|uniref:DUF262 domain-containing protein n=1 Tax=Marinobacter zhejiangensis TaxID=488535 RepID=A0A1I4NIL9_9GAMM|nr:DUF262 domain-containing protein [Marinobacter zhejiangensis]SFM15306.1 Protein of unknown function [Marinobacter zhejiangensis]